MHGYRAWGEKLIAKLRGMFAIAVWDRSQRCLMLARDRIGEKPLYYLTTEAGLYFASTVEALALMQSDRNIDPAAIACYLAHSFIPASHTVWQMVHVMPPAHVLRISPGEPPQLQRYWEFPRTRPGRMHLKHCMESVETVLQDSVTRCLDADVPVGDFSAGASIHHWSAQWPRDANRVYPRSRWDFARRNSPSYPMHVR